MSRASSHDATDRACPLLVERGARCTPSIIDLLFSRPPVLPAVKLRDLQEIAAGVIHRDDGGLSHSSVPRARWAVES
jgi:hypothetical protein